MGTSWSVHVELNPCAREKTLWWILGVWFYLAPTELLVSSLHFSRAGTEASDKAGSVWSYSMKDALRKGISLTLLLKVKISRFVDQSATLPHLSSQLLSLSLFCCCTFLLCWYSQSLTPHHCVELLRVRKKVITSQAWLSDKHEFDPPLML